MVGRNKKKKKGKKNPAASINTNINSYRAPAPCSLCSDFKGNNLKSDPRNRNKRQHLTPHLTLSHLTYPKARTRHSDVVPGLMF